MIKLLKLIFKTAFLLIIIASLIFGYARLIEPYRLECRKISLSEKETAAICPFTIVLFGDTQFGFDYDCSHFEEVISMINSQEPDLIIFTGDLIDDLNTYTGDISEISSMLTRLSANFGKFAVYGNHDYALSGEAVYRKIMENGGFTVLENESFFLPELNVAVHGIDDCLIGFGDPSFLQYASEDCFNLVLCHEPDIFNELSDYSISLMLSGHTHGGQVRIPFYTDSFLPTYGKIYVSGLYESAGSFLYVTKGIGTTKLPLRFRAVPEVTVITVGQ